MAISKEVIIVIPIYKELPSENEWNCLVQISKLFQENEKCLVFPEGLTLESYRIKELNFTLKPFPAEFFQGIAGYNRLMLSNFFYGSFSHSKYILICQLDAWIFNSDVKPWMSKNIDYVGAPWMHNDWGKKVYYFLSTSDYWLYRWVFKFLFLLHRKKLLVGNGGLSLRKTSKFMFLTKFFEKTIQNWPFHEDILWALLGTILKPYFSSAPVKTAISFSFEENPAKAFELNNHRLPFGCHAWEKDTSGFWNQYIPYLQSK